jgi:hypothetical protein
VRSGACHPISRRRLARKPIILNHEGGSSAAMAVNDGQELSRNQEVQETKEMSMSGRRSTGLYVVFHPLFILPCKQQPIRHGASSHTTRRSYPGDDKGAQAPPISQHWSAKWWYRGAETEHPTHPVCAVSHRFKNRGHGRLNPHDLCCASSHRFRDHGHDCLGTRDFRCAIIAHGELQRVMVPPGAPNITTSRMDRGPPRIYRAAPLL